MPELYKGVAFSSSSHQSSGQESMQLHLVYSWDLPKYCVILENTDIIEVPFKQCFPRQKDGKMAKMAKTGCELIQNPLNPEHLCLTHLLKI